MSEVYRQSRIWLTIDIEELGDTNFNLKWTKGYPNLNYEFLLGRWQELCSQWQTTSTCFVLGSFAKKHPQVISSLSAAGHEIASHGYTHDLVYEMEFDSWTESLISSKKLLEDITGQQVLGYRSASWSLPFEKRYYDRLCQCGYRYSSSYFPFKTYMYGHEIDKKLPFDVYTESGIIREIPLLKHISPFSGGFYLRILPTLLQRFLIGQCQKKMYKPIVYIHPYELSDESLGIKYFKQAKLDINYLLAFLGTGSVLKKINGFMVLSKKGDSC